MITHDHHDITSSINREKRIAEIKSVIDNMPDRQIDRLFRYLSRFGFYGRERTETPKSKRCVYGKDTGETLNVNRPCMGNRIECQHPENEGHIGCRSLCKPTKCKYFEPGESA